MKKLNFESPFALGASFITIVAPKVCCWSSAFTAISGGTSYLAWVYPMRPWLFGLSFLSIGYSYYKISRKKNENGCGVCNSVKTSFFTSKNFTYLVTAFVVTMLMISYFVK